MGLGWQQGESWVGVAVVVGGGVTNAAGDGGDSLSPQCASRSQESGRGTGGGKETARWRCPVFCHPPDTEVISGAPRGSHCEAGGEIHLRKHACSRGETPWAGASGAAEEEWQRQASEQSGQRGRHLKIAAVMAVAAWG